MKWKGLYVHLYSVSNKFVPNDSKSYKKHIKIKGIKDNLILVMRLLIDLDLKFNVGVELIDFVSWPKLQ